MNHLGGRGIRPDFSELVKGVQNLLGRPGARAGFPGIGQTGKLDPNDIFGGNRDKIRDLLDSNGLFHPGERTYQGDSQRDWFAAGSMIPEHLPPQEYCRARRQSVFVEREPLSALSVGELTDSPNPRVKAAG